jgi:hypothetical protein
MTTFPFPSLIRLIGLSDPWFSPWVISPYVLSLRGLPLPPTYVFVTVIQAQIYVASTVNANYSYIFLQLLGIKTYISIFILVIWNGNVSFIFIIYLTDFFS